MSLRLKTILGVGLIEAILLAILITTVLNYMRGSSEDGMQDYVDTTTQLFATTTKDAVLSFDLASLETFIEEILKNRGLLYTRVYDGENNLLASGGDTEFLDKPFKADTDYHAIDDTVYDSETFITVDNTVYGRIEMGFSTKRIQESLSEVRQLAATIAIIEMILVGLFSFALGVYLTNQLKVLRNSARAIAAGDLSHSIDIKTHDEVGEVAHSFNKMIGSLNAANKENEKYQEELLELNKTLEERVERRTQKVMEQKQKLEEAYDQLKVTQKQLVQSEKMASIGQLAAGVAHEINNPVAFVKSNINSLKRYVGSYQQLITLQNDIVQAIAQQARENNDEAMAQLQEKIAQLDNFYEEEDIEFINEDIDTLLSESITGTSRVEEIVKGLKSYSRESDDSMEPCDLNACLEETLKMLHNELKHACEVNTVFTPLPMCQCNKGKIVQVFTNLIVNAVQAMDQNGKLTVTTQHKRNDEGKDAILIRISDTGKGIPPENLSKLFDPFFTTKPVGQGTGLGLSISHGIIEDHGGTISVDSEVGKGTTFNIGLPVDQPAT